MNTIGFNIIKLAIAAILALGTTSLMADSEVNTNDNTNIGLILDFEVSDSVIGTSIEAEDSTVNANGNTNINLILDSEISGSIVGTQIKAK